MWAGAGQKGGALSAHLGIHGDSPGSGGVWSALGEKRNLGNQISRFKATHSHPSSGCLTRDLKLRAGYLTVPQPTQL